MNKLILLVGMVCLPLRHLSLSSPFGYRIHPVTGDYSFHAGVDLRAHHDTVYAVLYGTVTETSVNPFLGVYIRLDHGDFQSSYGHLSQIFVLPGDTVIAGTAIGLSGSTGRTTGEHLHFSIQYKHRYINPMAFLYAISWNTKK